MLFPLVWYRIIIIFLGPIQKQYNLWNYCDIFSVCFLRRIPIHWHVWTSRGSTLLYIYIPFYILHCFHLQKVKVHENIVFTISILQIKSLRRPWIPLKCIKKKKKRNRWNCHKSTGTYCNIRFLLGDFSKTIIN